MGNLIVNTTVSGVRQLEIDAKTFHNIGCPLIITGLATVLLTLFTLLKDTQTLTSTRLVLSCAVIADGGHLICLLTYLCVVERADPTQAYLHSMLFYFKRFFETFRNWIVVVMAFEHFLFFYNPREFKAFWAVDFARKLAMLVALSSLIFHSLHAGYAIAFDRFYYRLNMKHTLSTQYYITEWVYIIGMPFGLATMIYSTTMKWFEGESMLHIQDTNPTMVKVEMAYRNIFFVFAFTTVPSISILFVYILNEFYPDRLEELETIETLVATCLTHLTILNSGSKFFILILPISYYRRLLITMFQ
ncbi:unnamed protein product [Rodentolepis nana]|uniref:G_PROTEIN_RECEP_F1_2 domain-containing protein n=1 Tax=Rodentolepis nana TaxID=102285 RepID=A0A0R3TM47_RODNA|nr:unnamed protein product [Rodentolepis nana]